MSDEGHIKIDWEAELVGAVLNPHLVGFYNGDTLTEKDAAEIHAKLLAGELGEDHKFYSSKREPRATVHAAIRNVWDQIKHDREVASVPAVETPQQEAKRKAAKLAFGKKGIDAPLKHRADFRKLLIEQGATPREADAELEQTAKAFGTSLASLAPGRTPAAFKKLEDVLAPDKGSEKSNVRPRLLSNGPNAELEALADAAMYSLKSQGELYRRDPIAAAQLLAARGLAIGQLAQAKKPSTGNPWKAEFWSEKEQRRLMKTMPSMAASLMAAARK
jgi:hypothetical protein